MSDPGPPPTQTLSNDVSSTVTIVSSIDTQDGEPTLRVRLKKPKTDRKVQWATETVDNEDMNKKKSKCCCIYHKPKKFDESSSSESDEECEHCQGHVEKKHTHHEQAGGNNVHHTAPATVETVTETETNIPENPIDAPSTSTLEEPV